MVESDWLLMDGVDASHQIRVCVDMCVIYRWRSNVFTHARTVCH